MNKSRWTSRAVGMCPVCGRPVWQDYGPGRRKKYCKNACKQMAYRERKFERASTAFKAARG